MPVYGRSQTTLTNLDQDGLTGPNQTNTNLRLWGYSTGKGVGYANNCSPTGSENYTNNYAVDGEALQLNLAAASNCPSNCYGDLDFSDRLYQNDATASASNNFTLDLYATTDSVGNARSQALEFTIEQDVPSATQAAWDRYIYSWQCDYKGSTTTPGLNNTHPTGGIWNLWNGAANNGQGGWEAAQTTSGTYVPCAPYAVGKFVHYCFHFVRLPESRQIQFTDFTAVDSSGNAVYHEFNQVRGIQAAQLNWQTGLFTALQLDGDSAQEPYSVWADQWKVAYK